jgi:2,4-dienoyl-CoA reductase-like NADH-dependent reductase (Old Yellow Enzyme family)
MPDLDVLFSSYRLNALDLPNRVVMAPMTRSFSPAGVPTAEVAAYYRRRAENGVGLIITEGTGSAVRPHSTSLRCPTSMARRHSLAGRRW